MVGDLLRLFVAFVHVELWATALALETLSVTIVITLVALRFGRHADQVEIQIAPTPWPVLLAINVDNEGLVDKGWLAEGVRIARVAHRRLHQVETVSKDMSKVPPPIFVNTHTQFAAALLSKT